MVDIVVPREYGYVLGVAAVSALHLFSLGVKVGQARKAAGVEYPYVYADRAEAEKDKKKHIFNCVQRVHQNSLELFPVYSTLLLIGGLKHPEISAGAGAVYILGRMVYASGYSTGEPKKRVRGAFYYLGVLTLIGTAGSTIYNLLKV
ncbi:membrane-associated proteins in eicosanoid and glutathione metabolism [Backusella circina FSU 941]|nr:membrane-associated proteins in eicosanoid and glutathione metabolism [Backusella circina FSU 941]